jgi:hypothetical protein
VETNERAAEKIRANVEVLKAQAGLTDADLVIGKALGGIGYKVMFADDLTSEHVSEGEIHCATNTLRDSLSTRWWN